MKNVKTISSFFVLPFALLTLVLVGCTRSSDEVWDDTKSCTRHVNRGLGMLSGKRGDSRAVNSREEFYRYDPVGEDFIPFEDAPMQGDFGHVELNTPQPRETPGDPGSSVPGIEAFYDPSLNPQLSGIFKNVGFEYNQYIVKGDDNTQIIRNVAGYMKDHPNTYVFVEGHCDERGPEAFNLSLGSRRANGVRDLLINEGVHPDHIFAISYGKERPLVFDHHEEAWSRNRRAEFKIYQR